MAIEHALNESKGPLSADGSKDKKSPPLEVIRGGKFDDTPLIKRAKKILARAQNASNVNWLFSVFNQYSELLKEGSLNEGEEDIVKEIAAAATLRLADLGHSVDDQKDAEGIGKTEKYNL
jgi:hypothetical protein